MIHHFKILEDKNIFTGLSDSEDILSYPAESFSVGTQPESIADMTKCSVCFPVDPVQASIALDRLAINLQMSIQSFSKGKDGLNRLLSQSPDRVSFSTDDTTDHPETTLLQNLAWIGSKTGGDFAFGVPEEFKGQDTVHKFVQFFQNISKFCKPVLEIETRIEEAIFASSRVALDGGITTTWYAPTGRHASHIPLHRQSVSYTLNARIATLQLLGQIISGAIVIAAKLSIPGGYVMALPAVWKYFQDINAKISEADYPTC